MIELLRRILDWLASLQRPAQSPEPVPQHPALVAWIGLERFRQATGLSASRAQDWYPHVRAACLEFDITAPVRLAAFLAQVGHESGGFVHVREIWGPTAAQARYEGRADLGNTQPGDGSRYRGRALIQITGRHNYTAVAQALGIDCVNHPELLEQPANAARASAWWWAAHGCNELADSGDFRALTRRINGGTNGLADRMERWDRARLALGEGK